jgi:hypothetical protein
VLEVADGPLVVGDELLAVGFRSPGDLNLLLDRLVVELVDFALFFVQEVVDLLFLLVLEPPEFVLGSFVLVGLGGVLLVESLQPDSQVFVLALLMGQSVGEVIFEDMVSRLSELQGEVDQGLELVVFDDVEVGLSVGLDVEDALEARGYLEKGVLLNFLIASCRTEDELEELDEPCGEGLEVDEDVELVLEGEEIGFGDVENVEEKAITLFQGREGTGWSRR